MRHPFCIPFPAAASKNAILCLSAGTNTYLTGPGVMQSVAPHNDLQDTFIIQTHGRKRWMLWVIPQAMLPVTDDLVYGKAHGKLLSTAALGTPYADVTLSVGDVLCTC